VVVDGVGRGVTAAKAAVVGEATGMAVEVGVKLSAAAWVGAASGVGWAGAPRREIPPQVNRARATTINMRMKRRGLRVERDWGVTYLPN
jgi:hypothetical protein